VRINADDNDNAITFHANRAEYYHRDRILRRCARFRDRSRDADLRAFGFSSHIEASLAIEIKPGRNHCDIMSSLISIVITHNVNNDIVRATLITGVDRYLLVFRPSALVARTPTVANYQLKSGIRSKQNFSLVIYLYNFRESQHGGLMSSERPLILYITHILYVLKRARFKLRVFFIIQIHIRASNRVVQVLQTPARIDRRIPPQ